MHTDWRRSKSIGISVGMNVVLVVVLIFVLLAQTSSDHGNHAATERKLAGNVRSLKEGRGGAEAIVKESPSPAETGFDWRQIESTSYPAYVANLRRVGCPEQTIRDIITADLHAVYAGKSTERPDLSLKEKLIIDTLLEASVGSSAESVPGHRPPVRAVGSVPMPLVCEPVPACLHLSKEQLAVLQDLREQFQTDLGPVPIDTSDPGYRGRWCRAQSNSDDLLAGMLGGEFYLQYQLRVSWEKVTRINPCQTAP